jgi:4,5-dihydroxyphthalate decarboxylase
MGEVVLKTVTRTQGNNRALKDGTVVPENFRFAFEEVPVIVDAFRRMVRELEYDVSEMAFTTYLCAREHGVPFTALPIFLVRAFHHRAVLVDRNSGIVHPKDLEGRRVGVSRGYTVTTGVWARGILADEYGVDLDAVTWVPSGDEHVAEYRLPANVKPMRSGGDLVDLLMAGELAAVVGADISHFDVVPLIPDGTASGFEALERRGHYPINHLVVVRDDVLDARPSLAADIFAAFSTAKNQYVERLRAGLIEEQSPTDLRYARVLELTGSDPLPYGIEPNRAAIDELIRHARGQHILRQVAAVETLFAPGTLDLVG